jgi:hypothetical protein
MSDGRVGKLSPRHHAHRRPAGRESDDCASAGSIGFSFHMRSQRDVMAKTACMAGNVAQALLVSANDSRVSRAHSTTQHPRRTTSGGLEPGPFVVGQGIMEPQLSRGKAVLIARVGGTFDGRHTGQDPFVFKSLRIARVMSAKI